MPPTEGVFWKVLTVSLLRDKKPTICRCVCQCVLARETDFLVPWSSGLSRSTVTAKIAGSNPVGTVSRISILDIISVINTPLNNAYHVNS